MNTNNILSSPRPLIFDGAMGTCIQGYHLTLDDYQNLEGCSEILNISRPDVIKEIHASYLQVGCDFIETNTFGANTTVLNEYSIPEKNYELNKLGAQLAKEVANDFSTPDHPRFVAGSIGPGTKLVSLLQVTFDELKSSYTEQVNGLLDGGVDLLIIETSQDLLQVKAALVAAFEVFEQRKTRVPIITQVTIEQNGKMLVGSDMLTAITTLAPFDIDCLGLNCATGPKAMLDHVQTLSNHWPRLISVLPNAGLPKVVDGKVHYDLSVEEFVTDVTNFITTYGVNIVGGCCGTTPEYLKALVEKVHSLPLQQKNDDEGLPSREATEDRSIAQEPVTPNWLRSNTSILRGRTPKVIPSCSSLYSITPYNTEPKPLIVGERLNANGSKQFREYLKEENYDGMVSMAHEQEREQAHILDVCVAYTGSDEIKLMNTLVEKLNTDATIPLMIDSTDPEVIEQALKRIAGKPIINSVNLEDGGVKLRKVMASAKKYGAAIIGLTIDEVSMAKTADHKFQVAERIYTLATEEFGIAPEDLFFDALTFTLGSGDEEYRESAIETINAIRLIKERFPKVNTILGLSNISFGLSPYIRHRLNSVFLHECIEAGLDAAILHAGKIMPLYKIDEQERTLLTNLIYNKWVDDKNPLFEVLEFYKESEGKEESSADEMAALPVEERLKKRIIDGNRIDIDKDLDECRQTTEPLEIINTILLDGMKTVGELFGAGEMQLPFVLQSAETMKAAVKHLEPFMEKTEDSNKGSMLIATVKGDVHDIGKNLVDIILTNNGYKIHNIGVKQSIESILESYKEHKPHAIGMSGLLVQSTIVMKENLEVMNQLGITPPVILGGAALTREYVEKTLKPLYNGEVHYAQDAFDGLHILADIVARTKSGDLKSPPLQTTTSTFPPTNYSLLTTTPTSPLQTKASSKPPKVASLNRAPAPTPPFWGTKVIKDIPIDTITPYINRMTLYLTQWGMNKAKSASIDEWKESLAKTADPAFDKMVEKAKSENLLDPKIVYGYFPCNSEGNKLHVYAPPEIKPGREATQPDLQATNYSLLTTFDFPRQSDKDHLCLSDYFYPVSSGTKDLIAFHLVTIGDKASIEEKKLFETGEYTDYLYWHGFSVEFAEALAEYWHKNIREELKIADKDDPEIKNLFGCRYQGCRYSFGYPACPDLADQQKIFDLLDPSRIEVKLTEEYQLVPEQSTSAMIVHHPEAKYFSA